MKKRVILFAIIGMFLLMLPLAVGAEVVDSGVCGDNASWTLDGNGLLTVSGTGEMTSHPWDCEKCYHVIINEGITSICSSAFNGGSRIEDVSLPSSLTSIGAYAFYYCESLKSIIMPSGIEIIENRCFFGCGRISR